MKHTLKTNIAVLISPMLSITIVSIATLVFASGCANYRVGAGSMFRADVRTVHVPMITSNSFRPFLGERLTEAVVKQIESRSVYKVSSYERADTILEAKILADRKRVILETQFDDPRALEQEMFVELTWNDRLGRSMMQRPVIRINIGSVLIPEGGQSMTTAQQDTIDRIAHQIVNQMEVVW